MISRQATNIVYRLRLAFGLVILTILISVFVGGVQLMQLHRSQEVIAEHSVPTLVNAHKLEGQLSRLLALSNQLSSTDSKSQLIANHADFTLVAENVINTVEKDFGANDDLASIELLVEKTHLLMQTIGQIVPMRENILEIRESLALDTQSLATVRLAFNGLIEPRLISLATNLTNELATDSPKNDIGTNIATQINLTELSFRLASAVAVAEQMSISSGADAANIDTTNLRYELRSVAQILVSLENDNFRVELAVLIKQLRKLILGDGGIVQKLATYVDYRSKIYDLERSHLVINESISRINDSFAASAKADIFAASSIFSNTLNKTLLLLAVSGILVAVIIGLSSYFVIERQLNRRMSALTSNVLAIAAGEIERDTDVGGQDEIGLMSDALEVFKDNAKKLTRSNQELEQFAYAASHDLRSPLRAIENLAEWTLEDAGESMPNSCRDNLTKLISRVKRLSLLQTDLLEYSRAGHVDQKPESLDIPSLLKDLSGMLDPDGNYPIRFKGNYRPVKTYVTPLTQVLLNLVNNAIKHHDLDQGNITVTVTYDVSRLNFSIADDGAGIDPQYHNQIFGLFKRLQSQDLVEGSGLGLPLVKKLVENLGGKIAVSSNSAKGRGTVFEFDWPVFYTQQVAPKAA